MGFPKAGKGRKSSFELLKEVSSHAIRKDLVLLPLAGPVRCFYRPEGTGLRHGR
ncbi:MAG: hypothetical protein Ct9H300mP28_12540 [Pseudomonadota bacterium]|nr:MAG: hypothetical protein Ct9H300mP28_12540 [Pseudomonadota bacterium]